MSTKKKKKRKKKQHRFFLSFSSWLHILSSIFILETYIIHFISFGQYMQIIFLLRFYYFHCSIFFPRKFAAVADNAFNSPSVSFCPLLSARITAP